MLNYEKVILYISDFNTINYYGFLRESPFNRSYKCRINYNWRHEKIVINWLISLCVVVVLDTTARYPVA